MKINLSKYLQSILNTNNFSLLTPKLQLFQCQKFSTKQENPVSRSFRILKQDFKNVKDYMFKGKAKNSIHKNLPSHCDVLIIGGGAMGCSTAYWLKERAMGGLNVVVVEKDLTVISKNQDNFKYRDSTSVLSVGGLRQQFSLKENIELSLHSASFLRNIKHILNVENYDIPDIQFNPGGYLFLATDTSANILIENSKLQTSLGAKVNLLNPKKLKEMFPWMNTDGIALGCLGLENEGWFDPWSLICAFKSKAISLGAHFVGGEVIDFHYNKATKLLVTNQFESKEIHQLNEAVIRLPNGQEQCIRFAICVLCAGPYSGEVGLLAGVGKGQGILAAPIPVEPRKRFVYNIHCPDGPGLTAPLLIDPSGTYFRRDGLGGNYLCGRSPLEEEEPPTDNLEVDYEFFETHVWPVLAHRVPSFNNVKLKSAWAGYYDFNNFDENAFIGPHPLYVNLYLATGFSGHGIQQSPAVGKALMELIVDGEFLTIDLSRLSFNRYLERKPLWESNIV